MAKEFSRRNLFRLRWGDVSELVNETFGAPEAEAEESEEVEMWNVRPPGSLGDEEAFAHACDRCQLCSEACPYGVILHEGVIAEEGEGLPYLNVKDNPCRWCTDMPCIKACPTGALKWDVSERVAPIAKVSLDLSTCLTQEGILCDTCVYRCPAGIKAIRMVDRKPVLNEAACVGCGLCVYHCDSEPSSFSILKISNET